MPEEWRDNIVKNCPAKQLEGRNAVIDPELYNFEKFINFISIFGIYFGILIEQKYLGTHIYPKWN